MNHHTRHHTHCLRCGRPLTSTRSRTTGYGPTCTARIRHAGQVGHTARQVEDARELIADGGIIPLRTTRVGPAYRTVSTDGSQTYLTTTGHCTCPAGLKVRRCYHSAAALLLAA